MYRSAVNFCVFFLFALQSLASAFPDDDRECKRHNNEGVCTTVDGHFTCGCLFHEKPKLTIGKWNAETETRYFTQTCEAVELPYREDTCVVLPANPQNAQEYDFVCPDNGFFQTWGAYAPLKGSHIIRLWHRCCRVQCPKWNCQWTPWTEPQKQFELPLDNVYVQGARGRHEHAKKDSSWSLKLCVCDHSSTTTEKGEL